MSISCDLKTSWRCEGLVHLINIGLLSFLQEESLMESWRCCAFNTYKEMDLSGIRVIPEGCRDVLC